MNQPLTDACTSLDVGDVDHVVINVEVDIGHWNALSGKRRATGPCNAAGLVLQEECIGA